MNAYELARQLAARLATERPDLLPDAAQLMQRLHPCRHGPDFCSVVWHGQRFTLTLGQAAIVRQLWEAWTEGTLDVHGNTLLLRAGSESDRVVDVFKGSEAWGVLIVAGDCRGAYRLNDNPEPEPESQPTEEKQ